MHDTPSDDLLHYYKRELGYLREQGSAFAQRYPKVANSLALHGDDVRDPHVERLIEASAFLAARVHRDLDQSFPQVPAALLANACPSLGQPVPSMTIARMALDPAQGKVTAGYRVPRHTEMQVRTTHDASCRFRTAWDCILWPVTVVDAYFEGTDALRLTLATSDDTDFSELDIHSLRFHLNGDWTETMPLYDLLIANIRGVEIHAAPTSMRDDPLSTVEPQNTMLPASAWREVGFAPDETVLAPPDHAYLPYTLLQEYFAFPRKFLFFDLTVPDGALGRGRHVDIVLRLTTTLSRTGDATLTSNAGAALAVHAANFVLGCVPAINLFSRTSEPIVVDQRQYEYHLVADQRNHAQTEIYSVESVIGIDPLSDSTMTIPPLTGNGAKAVTPDAGVRWSARRERALRVDLSGTEIYLAFSDHDNTPAAPAEQTVYATVICTNRRLPEQVTRGATLLLEAVSQHVRAHCLYAPTSQFDPPLGSATLWHLVSLLTLNYQSLLQGNRSASHTHPADGQHTSPAHGKAATDDQHAAWLHDLLMLFATQSERNQKQIHGIRRVGTRPTTAHIGHDGWRGFCRGTEIVLQFDADAFVGSSPLLLSAVLSRFFAMYTSINAFVQLVSRGRDETWKKWPPMSGLQQLL
ncbi:type VI secretion protein [Robbsia andropogonis]|uniref:Type VI secretion protein n=1 Tax=Robbsia andropogonis TaxID=28092 RepID=A0A0F5JY39_9BURK|nr:type VI secretion system baseplate subunit TssF [Robbsia andropogonis]KKB62801.1 type VI secretion protein [Robbsia andropogonis]MCP1118042.1 type VI secretion system baseplate subunit TssF [Robbsia andropogonis]MCP1127677.1 type VI secretion system baseplate subunit TssF [Robbsia andropogonis]